MNTTTKSAPRKKRAPAKKQQLATVEASTDLAASQPVRLSPIEQMQQMKAMGVDVADMKEMLSLQREYEAGEALKAFNAALAAFKSEDIQIFKKKTVSYTTDKGVTEYKHATLDDIVAITVPYLSKHGFSHRWRTERLDGGMIKVTFILTHELGHSEETALDAGLDQSGGKNNIQALASTVTYLERYTFLAGTGLAVKDMDNDGATSEIDYVTEEQVANIQALIEEVGANEVSLLHWLKVDCLENIPAGMYHGTIKALEAKR